LKYEALIPDQHLYRGEFDTVYHRIHHSLTPLSSMSNTDISFKLLDAFCSENVVNEIVKNLLKKD
jgi:recombinational DNA repair protein RecR